MLSKKNTLLIALSLTLVYTSEKLVRSNAFAKKVMVTITETSIKNVCNVSVKMMVFIPPLKV